MSTPPRFMQAQKGMGVFTSDGVRLGKITEIWYGQDPTDQDPRCDEATCSRLEVHHGLFGRHVLFIPYHAVADVTEQRVTLNVDRATADARSWEQRPQWIAQPVGYRIGTGDHGG